VLVVEAEELKVAKRVLVDKAVTQAVTLVKPHLDKVAEVVLQTQVVTAVLVVMAQETLEEHLQAELRALAVVVTEAAELTAAEAVAMATAEAAEAEPDFLAAEAEALKAHVLVAGAEGRLGSADLERLTHLLLAEAETVLLVDLL
jgi:hypothetical protein